MVHTISALLLTGVLSRLLRKYYRAVSGGRWERELRAPIFKRIRGACSEQHRSQTKSVCDPSGCSDWEYSRFTVEVKSLSGNALQYITMSIIIIFPRGVSMLVQGTPANPSTSKEMLPQCHDIEPPVFHNRTPCMRSSEGF